METKTRVCARDGCNKVFQPKNGRQIYCSRYCLGKVTYQKGRERRRQTHKIEMEKNKICLWCKQIFHSPSRQSKFCSGECSGSLSRMKSKVMTFYMFEGYSQERVAQEISKLYKLGKDYKITE